MSSKKFQLLFQAFPLHGEKSSTLLLFLKPGSFRSLVQTRLAPPVINLHSRRMNIKKNPWADLPGRTLRVSFSFRLSTMSSIRFSFNLEKNGSNDFHPLGISKSKNKIGFKPTWVGLLVAVGSCRRGSVAGLHLEGVRALLFTIENHLREDLPTLEVDLEEVLALVTGRVDDVVVHLKMEEEGK